MIRVVYIILRLVLVHGPDGQEVEFNPEEISSIRKPQLDSDEHFAKGTRCILVMTNGKFIGTVETCGEVIRSILEVQKGEK